MLTLVSSLDTGVRADYLENCIRKDLSEGRSALLIVPEQQGYLSEKQFADIPNARLLEIVNFSKLAENVFRKFGGPKPVQIAGTTKSLLMWDTLHELAPTLRKYGNTGRRETALTAKLLASVAEFESNGISSDDLEEARKKLPCDSQLADKVSDLSVIYALYRDKCHTYAGFSPSERLLLLAEKLATNPCLSGKKIYIDSFMSFTYPEYAVLRAVLAGNADVTVLLCTDTPLSKKPYLASVKETATRLLKIAGDGCKTVNLPARAGIRPEMLEYLTDNVWNFSVRKESLPSLPADGSVLLFTASNRYDESECCAKNILSLVKDGYRFGEIAILLRNPDSYRGILDATLEEHGISCFFSERTDLSSKPLSRLLLYAVRASTHGFTLQDVMALVKTGLCGVDLRDVAFFEEYCDTWRITGKRFFDDCWEMNPDGLTDRESERGKEILASANRVREKVITPLRKLSQNLSASLKTVDRCRAVWEYLTDIGIRERLAEQAKSELDLGQTKEAGETLRLYRYVAESLSELATLLPDATASSDDFLSLLSLFFADADLGSVPNRQDCVVIGSSATARFDRVRAVFVLGAVEGEFPRTVADDGLLCEQDKDSLSDHCGINFDARAKKQNAEELFYVWRAYSMPSEKLYLSCPIAETDGTELTQSLAFTRAKYLLQIEKPQEYVGKIRQPDFENAPELKANPLPSNSKIYLSASKIQDFAQCPYRYYSTYILTMRSRKDSRLSPADEGTFLHFVFEQFLKKCLRDGKLYLPEKAELRGMTDSIVGEYFKDKCKIPSDRMDTRLLHIFERLRCLAGIMLRDIVGEIGKSRFVPSKFEQKIGGKDENSLPSVEFDLRDGGKVVLGGKVDRIDVWEDGGKTYIRVVDYKSSEHKFSLDDVKSGEDIQLVLYLFAVSVQNPDAVPCGAEFVYQKKKDDKTYVKRDGFILDEENVRSAVDTTTYAGNLKVQTLAELKSLMKDMEDAVCSIAENILSGKADKTPSEKSCAFCPVADYCDVAAKSFDK